MLKPSGFTKKSWCSITFPMASCSCQAICIQRGQLSVSLIGALKRLGKPVVSVSNIKYIEIECFRLTKLNFECIAYAKSKDGIQKSKNRKINRYCEIKV